MKRRTLREHCFKLLFCMDFYPETEVEDQIEGYLDQVDEDESDDRGEQVILHHVGLTREEGQELSHRVRDVAAHLEEIDRSLEGVMEGWRLARVGKAELTILRLACYEMRLDPGVPQAVAINEAVELAKKYGQDESASFINGILAKLVD